MHHILRPHSKILTTAPHANHGLIADSFSMHNRAMTDCNHAPDLVYIIRRRMEDGPFFNGRSTPDFYSAVVASENRPVINIAVVANDHIADNSCNIDDI